jgi:anti-sigma B factor antagonist
MSMPPERPGSGDTSYRATTTGENTDPAAWCSFACTTQSLPHATGEIIVLRVAGEVDRCTLPILHAALDESLDHHPTHLLVDLAWMTFCSARGLDLLTHTGHTTTETATRFAVCGVAPHIDRLWTLIWEGDLPIRHRSIAAAMTAIRLPSKTEHCGPPDTLTPPPTRGQPHHKKPSPSPAAGPQTVTSPTSTASLVTLEHRRIADDPQGHAGWA